VAEILVINPNSSVSVTQSMDACLDAVRLLSGHNVRCSALEKGPPGIETDAHIMAVIPHLLERIAGTPADAYVIGCFSDPGLEEARAATSKPVVGIGEAAYLAALGLGRRFGVVSILATSVPRHVCYISRLGLSDRLAGDRPIGLGVSELKSEAVMGQLVRVGKALRDDDGADVLILGCAGLGSHRHALEEELGLPVVDPVQAGAAQACVTATLRYPRRP
jgi:Asp/Glu/hydantoin racemase